LEQGLAKLVGLSYIAQSCWPESLTEKGVFLGCFAGLNLYNLRNYPLPQEVFYEQNKFMDSYKKQLYMREYFY